MNHQLKHLLKRQHKLQAKAAQQRQDLSENMHHWHTRLRWLDRGLAAAGFVKRHPTALFGAGAILAYFIPNRSGKVFLGAYAALKGLRKFLHIFSSNKSSD
jgi:hypothetical protein